MVRGKTGLWCLVLLLGGALLAGAQGPNERGIQGVAAKPADREPQKWAIIIGVAGYDDSGLPPLPNAVNDAKSLHKALLSAGGFDPKNVLLMVDDSPESLHCPKRSNIYAMVESWLAQCGKRDQILFYFAGHGVDFKNQLYLMPLDARSVNIEHTGVPYAFIVKKLDEAKSQRGADRSVIILDACHSGKGRGGETMTRGMQESLQGADGRITLASCSADESSHEFDNSHGAFTYFLLRGLAGDADANNDKLITAMEMAQYTYDSVRNWAAGKALKQTPRMLADLSGDIVITAHIDIEVVLRPPKEGTAKPPVAPAAKQYKYLAGKQAGSLVTGSPDLNQFIEIPDGRFEDNGDGTVRDTHLNVEWQKTPPPTAMVWKQAENYCQTLSLAGKSGWRLPHVEELQTLTCSDGATITLDTTYFDECSATITYWTDTKESLTFGAHLSVRHNDAIIKSYDNKNAYAVRAVRDAK